MTFHGEVEVSDGSGPTWFTNSLRFDTEEEARDHVVDLAGRWTLVKRGRVVEDSVPLKETAGPRRRADRGELRMSTMLNDSLYSSVKDDWETPKALFAVLDAEFGFRLDVCASADNAKCDTYFDKDRDGLGQSWEGPAWMNPPYGSGIKPWVAKAAEAGRQICVVALLPARTDTQWWHRYVMTAAEIRLLTRRLTFEGANNKATFPAAVVVFQPHDHRWPLLRSMVS